MAVAGSFWYLEAAFGRVYGVVKTATGYCGGIWIKPTYSEVIKRKINPVIVIVLITETKFSLGYKYNHTGL